MSNVPANLRYTKSHEWVEKLEDGSFRIGITDHAQDLLGDMVYVEVPQIGRSVKAAEECAVVESVKAASDVYSPLSGEIIAVNETLNDNPDTLNRDPYGEGWIFSLKPSNLSEWDSLLDANAYQGIAEDDH
jgi:glycine cleavage system H protein